MKKQINPSIQAHLLRSALILLSLVTSNQDIFCQTPTPTATATSSPSATECPRPTPGTCVSYEAESDNNTLTGSAFVLSCPTCSGGEKVGYVGNNSGTLQFNAIGIVVPGRQSVTISYTNGDAVRYALLSVNGDQGFPLTFPSTGSFQTVGSIQTTVVLNTGCNTLEFYNPIVGSWTPDFDRIQFNCPTSYLGNISTRSFVQTGDDVMIGGFIVQGTGTKRVIIRAIGPELSQYGVPNPLADPTLELHDGTGALIASNDNWQTTIIGGIITSNQISDIQNSGHPPTQTSESAIIANLPPGSYTAIVRGATSTPTPAPTATATTTPTPTATPVNNTTGVALVEVYDLSPSLQSILDNISTRSLVETGDSVMIGGFIVQGTQPKNVIIRAIGPGLSQYRVSNPLANPTLELHNGTGDLIATNDNWQHTIIGGVITGDQVQSIQNSGHAPGDASESAIIANLPPGNYTATVRGVNNTSGVALVEMYDLD
jgi:Alpha-galactosidase, CBM13 domain